MWNFGKINCAFLSVICGLWLLVAACNNRTSYAELVSQELARESAVDSLLLGLYFDMPMERFFSYCFEMNQKGVFFQYGGRSQVLHTYEHEFSTPVDFVFFPVGGHAAIQQLEGTMTFKNWAPFSKEFTAGKLQEEVKVFLEKQLGGRPFIQVDHPQGYWPYAYVKVDSNRKILLYRSFDDQKVHLVFENLRAKS